MGLKDSLRLRHSLSNILKSRIYFPSRDGSNKTVSQSAQRPALEHQGLLDRKSMVLRRQLILIR